MKKAKMKKPNTRMLRAKLRRKGPKVGIVAGVILGVGSAIYACMKARKMDEECAEINQEIEDAKAVVEQVKDNSSVSDQYVKDAKKKLRDLKIKKGIKLARMFAIPVIVGIFSATLIFGSFNTIAAEFVSASALAKKLDTDFKAYRQAAVDKYGEAADEELRFASMTKKENVTTINPETGEIKTEEKPVMDKDRLSKLSPYAIPFCRTYCGDMFKDEPYHDMMTINNAVQDLQLDLDIYRSVTLDQFHKSINYDVTPDSKRVGYVRKNDEHVDIKYTIRECVFNFFPERGDEAIENGYVIDFPDATDILDEIPVPQKKCFLK